MADSVLSTTQQLHSIWGLGGLTSKQLVKRVWNGMNDTDLFGRASELAYNFLLALFPLVLFLLSLFGLFASRGTQLRGNLMFYFAQVLPPMAFQVINQTINEVTKNSSGGKITFGIIVSLWVASGGMNSMMSTLNGAYGVREGRSMLKVRSIAVALTIGIATLVISALILVLVGSHIADFIGSELGVAFLVVKAWKILQWPAALAFLILSFSLIYFYGPDLKEQHWYWITPGSVFGVLVWLAASFGFRVYLHFYNTYSGTYGSLGAVIILMVWFYVTGLAFLIGGEINAQIEHAAAERGHPEAKLDHQKAA
ncbi:MAG: YihY/virulence factor BrkB family protein [Terriglobales bacterium]